MSGRKKVLLVVLLFLITSVFLVFQFKQEVKRFILPYLPKPEVAQLLITIPENTLELMGQHVVRARQQEAISKDLKIPYSCQVFEKDTITASIRLKGNLLDHVTDYKWSFRVSTINSVYSLNSPATRSFLYEWLFHELLKQEDVLYLQYKFVNLFINGVDWGIYAVEEVVSEYYFKQHNIEPSTVLKFDEDDHWAKFIEQRKSNPVLREYEIVESYFAAPIISSVRSLEFDTDSISIEHLSSFRDGKASLDSLFNIDKLAKLCAIADLLGGHHAISWRNIRFYFNQTTNTFEPIGYCAECNGPIKETLAQKSKSQTKTHEGTVDFRSRVFQSGEFMKAYRGYLSNYIKTKLVVNFLSEHQVELDSLNGIINYEFPFASIDEDFLLANEEVCKAFLDQ